MSAEEADKTTTTTDASGGDEEEEWLYGGIDRAFYQHNMHVQ